MIKTSDSHPIYLNFVQFKWSEHGNQLGITLAPGKQQAGGWSGHWRRDLAKDLQRIKTEYKVGVVVSLLQQGEAQRLGIANELEECNKIGIGTYNFPVQDGSIPTNIEDYKKMAKEVVNEHLRKGKNVLVHCMGGLGRAPTFAATCLICAGVATEEAIRLVQKGRPNSLTTPCQISFLRQLKFE